MKKTILSLVSTLVFFFTALPVSAQTVSTFSNSSTVSTNSQLKAPNHLQSLTVTPQMNRLQQRAQQELTRRLTALQTVQGKINNLKMLSTDQKASLSAQLQNEITSLTMLQTKIQSDTTPQTLRADVQSILSDYRIFALFLPQLQILIASDKLANITDDLQVIAGKLQTRISTFPLQGNELLPLQNALSDMQSKLANAKQQSQNSANLVIGLTPSGYPGNKSSLQTARTDLQTGRQQVIAILQDVQTIIDGLTTLGGQSSSSTLSQ